MVKRSPNGLIYSFNPETLFTQEYYNPYIAVTQIAIGLHGKNFGDSIVAIPCCLKEYLRYVGRSPSLIGSNSGAGSLDVASGGPDECLAVGPSIFFEAFADYVAEKAPNEGLASKLYVSGGIWRFQSCTFDREEGERELYLNKELVLYNADIQEGSADLSQEEHKYTRVAFRSRNLIFVDSEKIEKSFGDQYRLLKEQDLSREVFTQSLVSFIAQNNISEEDYIQICGIEWTGSSFKREAKNWAFTRTGETTDFINEITLAFAAELVRHDVAGGDDIKWLKALFPEEHSDHLAKTVCLWLSVHLGACLDVIDRHISEKNYGGAALAFLHLMSEMESLDRHYPGALQDQSNQGPLIGMFSRISARQVDDKVVEEGERRELLESTIKNKTADTKTFATWAHNLIDKVYHDLFYSDKEREEIFASRQQELGIKLPPVADIKAPPQKPTIGVSQLNNDPSIDPRELIYDRLSCKISLCSITGKSVNLSWEKEFVLENQLFLECSMTVKTRPAFLLLERARSSEMRGNI